MSQSYRKRTGYKFGIRVPMTVDEAMEIDGENGDTQWFDAIQKEMENVFVAFNILEEGETAPPTYKKIPIHFIFDLKMDFTHKA